jgi:hypothetical protein
VPYICHHYRSCLSNVKKLELFNTGNTWKIWRVNRLRNGEGDSTLSSHHLDKAWISQDHYQSLFNATIFHQNTPFLNRLR